MPILNETRMLPLFFPPKNEHQSILTISFQDLRKCQEEKDALQKAKLSILSNDVIPNKWFDIRNSSIFSEMFASLLKLF